MERDPLKSVPVCPMVRESLLCTLGGDLRGNSKTLPLASCPARSGQGGLPYAVLLRGRSEPWDVWLAWQFRVCELWGYNAEFLAHLWKRPPVNGTPASSVPCQMPAEAPPFPAARGAAVLLPNQSGSLSPPAPPTRQDPG